jgi:hypothetical protein
MSEKTKTCIECGEPKPLRQFGRRRKLRAEAVNVSEKLGLVPKDLCLVCESASEKKGLSSELEARKKEREDHPDRGGEKRADSARAVEKVPPGVHEAVPSQLSGRMGPCRHM